MKKLLVLLLVLALAATLFIGCTSDAGNEPNNNNNENNENADPAKAEGDAVKIGLGTVTSISKSRDAGDDNAMAQVDTVMVTATFDADGKVVKAVIDTAQSKVEFDEDMQVTTDLSAGVKTKNELGDDYGMRVASSIDAEWDEQAAALAEWMEGKTVAEITGMDLEDGKPADEELTSSVTIGVGSYLAALEKAYNNAVDLDGSVAAEKLGLGTIINIAKSKGAEGDDNAKAQVNTTMTAVAFDADGKVAGAVIDVLQTSVDFDADGKVESDENGPFLTKNELGEDYGMIRASDIEKEWYEQAASLAEWMVGKTSAEISALDVEEKDPAHPAVPTDPELTSSVTITVQDYLAGVEKANATAK